MTIEQKAWNIAHKTSPGIKDTASQHSDREEAARLGIIEGLEMAIEMVEQYPSPLDDLPMAMAMRNVSKAIRALIEEQKV